MYNYTNNYKEMELVLWAPHFILLKNMDPTSPIILQ